MGVVYSLAKSPTYQATARILVSPLPQDDTTFVGLPLIRDSGDPTRTMQTVAGLIDSPQTIQASAAALGRGWSFRRVQSTVNVQPEGQSEILDVTATAASARRAAKVANVFANTALGLRAIQLRALVAQQIAATSAQLATIKDRASVAAADLETQLNQLRSLSSGQDPTVTLSSAAPVPLSTSGLSKPVILLLALVAALFLGAGAALLREFARAPRVLVEEEVVSIVPGPILARIPSLSGRSRRAVSGVRGPIPPAISEALRGVRIQLDLMAGRHRTILVTSASQGDGKTTTALNLAREIAASGARALVVGADLRHPDIGARFGIQPETDLASALASSDPMSWVRDVSGDESLQVLPAVGKDDFETLDRVARGLGGFLEEALERVDYVILDAPPLGEVADVLRFISAADDVLLVSRLGHTKVGSLEVTKEFLDRADRRPTGHVIIGSSRRHAPRYGYYRSTSSERSPRAEPTQAR